MNDNEVSLREFIEEKFDRQNDRIKALHDDVKDIGNTIDGNGKPGLKATVQANRLKIALIFWVGGPLVMGAGALIIRAASKLQIALF